MPETRRLYMVDGGIVRETIYDDSNVPPRRRTASGKRR